jgi:hypothetical protein
MRGDDEIVLPVEDTGCRINEYERDAVLKRFYRSHKT